MFPTKDRLRAEHEHFGVGRHITGRSNRVLCLACSRRDTIPAPALGPNCSYAIRLLDTYGRLQRYTVRCHVEPSLRAHGPEHVVSFHEARQMSLDEDSGFTFGPLDEKDFREICREGECSWAEIEDRAIDAWISNQEDPS